MPAPQREDYDTVIKDLQTRLDRLERASRSPAVFIPNGPQPATPVDGGAVYVQAGQLRYIGSGGTVTPIANP